MVRFIIGKGWSVVVVSVVVDVFSVSSSFSSSFFFSIEVVVVVETERFTKCRAAYSLDINWFHDFF